MPVDDQGTVTGGKLVPTTLNLDAMPKVNVFYAKFVPVLGSMTIERQNGTSDEGNGDRVFVYRITAADDPAFELYVSIKGNGSEVTGIAAVGSEKSDIRVENTGNVKEFIRLRLVSYYVDANGDIVGTVSSQYPTLSLKNGWIAGANHTYYYPFPTDPGGMTEILCEPFSLGQMQLADGKTVYQVIEVIAEAVQAEPISAVREAWGVTVTNNTITAAQ